MLTTSYSYLILMNLEFSQGILKNTQYENVQCEPSCPMRTEGGRTDRHDNAASRFS
jgi:hypothetical protein